MIALMLPRLARHPQHRRLAGAGIADDYGKIALADYMLQSGLLLTPQHQAPTPDGVHTAASSSQISDGAAAVLMMTAERAEQLGLRQRARVADRPEARRLGNGLDRTVRSRWWPTHQNNKKTHP